LQQLIEKIGLIGFSPSRRFIYHGLAYKPATRIADGVGSHREISDPVSEVAAYQQIGIICKLIGHRAVKFFNFAV
jgi:hypothetical protein